MIRRARAVLAGLGFILTGLILSSHLPERLPEIRMFGKEIFRTNCMLLFGQDRIDPHASPQLPLICSTISQVLPIVLMVNGIVLCLFGMTRFACAVSILNLMAFTAFYCNPMIDSSFRSYSHFLQVAICVGAFLVVFLRGGQNGSEKSHRD